MLAVTYASSTTCICTVTSGCVVSVVTSGTCTIRAKQAGGLSGGISYAVAPAISQSFTVRTAQTIVFADPSPLDQNATPFTTDLALIDPRELKSTSLLLIVDLVLSRHGSECGDVFTPTVAVDLTDRPYLIINLNRINLMHVLSTLCDL